MSERDSRYAGWWEPVVGFLILFVLIGLLAGSVKRDILDLQRRVGQIESEKKK